MKKQRKTAKFKVAMGQTGLLMSLLLIALLLGLVPDRRGAIRNGRAALAESVAINITGHVVRERASQMEADLQLVVERNPDLVSAGIRKNNGRVASVVGEHETNWQPMSGEYSSDTQVMVPIYAKEDKWGQLELKFANASELWGLTNYQSQMLPLVIFLAGSSFFVFYFYLGKMLKHLDPSRAIPRRVRTALDTMAEGLLVIDAQSQIVLANSAISETLGQEVEELIGSETDDYGWELDSADESLAPWTACLQTSEPQRNVLVRLKDAQGSNRTFFVNCSPVLVAGGKLGGALISFDDVTLLEEKKKELGVAMEAAEAANESKSQFLANMSHEIRTPMNAILGFTDVLRRGHQGNSRQDALKYLNTIHSSGTHLLELINDILDLSKVEAGKLEIEKIECAPHKIAHEVVEILRVKAQEKQISLELMATGSVPKTIVSDAARIRQVVTNLVGNAIKFTEEGSVCVNLSYTPERSRYLIEVLDTGVGLTDDQMEKIFSPFSQADSSVNRKHGGTGLGLTISRHFADALGGSLKVSSLPGKGSLFTLSIDPGPIDNQLVVPVSELEFEQAEQVNHFTWEFEPKRVLVIDDGQENRDLVSVVLNDVGLVVDEAENGKIGAEKATEGDYDLILMDIQMPVMNGYESTRLIRERGLTVPIFALTANAMKGFEQKCLDAGCSGFMTKPIDIDSLLETLGEVLDGTRVVRTSSDDGIDVVGPVAGNNLSDNEFASSSPECVVPNLDDQSPIRSSLPMHIPRFQKIVSKFIPRLRSKLEEMNQAAGEGDMATLKDLAHWLKGAGGTVGFNEFNSPAASLETAATEFDQPTIELRLMEIGNLLNRVEAPVDAEDEPVGFMSDESKIDQLIEEINSNYSTS